MITKYKTFEGIKWYSKGKFEEEEFDDGPIESFDDDIIRVGDHIMVNGTYNNTSFNNNGKVVRIFSTFPSPDKRPPYILQVHGKNIDIVIKIPGRRDGGRSQYSQHNDCFKFSNMVRNKAKDGVWDGTYVYSNYYNVLKIKKI